MEYVGSDGKVYVCERKEFLERMVYGLESGFMTGGMKDLGVTIGQMVDVNRLIKVPGRKAVIFSELFTGSVTLWTATIVSARYKRLLWVITNKHGKYGMASAPDPIATHHLHASFTSGTNWR
jgi:hypothetical protein